jgi:DNA-binding response OmpR family regulator
MGYENAHQSVLLLLDGKTSANNEFIKRWFQKSRFLTCEVTDIFQALEEIADFTMPQRPDVILLEVSSISDDFDGIKRVTQTFAGQTELPIFAFSDNANNDKEYFQGNLAQLQEKLDGLIPVCGESRQSIAA